MELARREEPASAALERLVDARRRLATLSIDDLVSLRIFAEAVQAQARAQKAAELAQEAAGTRIRAERRLGQILWERERRGQDNRSIDIRGADTFMGLARIPDDLFEKAATDLAKRSKACSPQHVYALAARLSLRELEPGIYVSFDDVHYLHAGKGENRPGGVAKIWARSLDEAREQLRRELGLRKAWTSRRVSERLDDAHSRSRRLSQQISLLQSVTRDKEALEKVKAAELLEMKVARLLYDAVLLENWREHEEAG